MEGLLAQGRRTFTRDEAEAALDSSPVATYHSLHRLQKGRWLAMPRLGFYLIIARRCAGSIDHIASVIAELAERLDAGSLLAVAKKGEEMPVVQRLGWLLDHTGHVKLGKDLAKLVRERKPKMVPLEPSSVEEVSARDAKWRVVVNTTARSCRLPRAPRRDRAPQAALLPRVLTQVLT